MRQNWARAVPFLALRALPRRARFRLAIAGTVRAEGRPPVLMRLRDGLVMELDLGDHLQRTIAGDCHERPEEDVTCALLRPGDCVVDVGANIGYNSLRWAQEVAPSGCVYAFEPIPPNLAALRTNLGLNPSLPVEVASVALGRAPGSVSLSSDRPGETSGSYSVHNANPGGFEVDVTTLDAWAATKDLGRLRLIKIDVEGFEVEVLAGATATLAAHRPHVLVEWNRGHGATDQLWEALADLASRLDYDRSVIVKTRVAGRGRLSPLPASSRDVPYLCNLLLSPR